jgi:hypothetical protein
MSSENPQDNSSPSNHRLALVVGGIALGIIVALGFSLLYKSEVKTLDVVFWAIGGGLLGLSASLTARRK